MSYELVDAVNQQCELKNRATDLLILTKFAELVPNPEKPELRIGQHRFEAITRLSERTLQTHLQDLHNEGLLECIDGNTVKGVKPKLYRLNLPEGFDRAVVAERRRKYYGGKPFVSLYSEDLDGKDAGSKYSLPPIPRNAVDANIADPFSEESANSAEKPANSAEKSADSAEKSANLAEKSANSAPYNNIIIKKDNNNNNNVVVVDDNCEVDLVLAFAVKATGAKDSKPFEKLVNSDNAPLVYKAIEYFREQRNSGNVKIGKNPVRYLCRIIKTTIEENGANLDSGRLEVPKKCSAELTALAKIWNDFILTDHRLSKIGAARHKLLTTKLRDATSPGLPQYDIESRAAQLSKLLKDKVPSGEIGGDELYAALNGVLDEFATQSQSPESDGPML